MMKYLVSTVGLLVSVMSVCPGGADAASATELVRIPGEVPAALATATRLGEASSRELPLTLTVVLNRADQRGFEAFVRDVKDPRSPLHGRYLGQKEIADG